MRIYFTNIDNKIINAMTDVGVYVPNIGDKVQVYYEFNNNEDDVIMLEPDNSEHFATVISRKLNIRDNELYITLCEESMNNYYENMKVMV